MEQPTKENSVERSLDVMLRDAQRAKKGMRRKLEYTTQNRDRLDLECADLRTRIDELDERIGKIEGHIASRNECMETEPEQAIPQYSEYFNI